MKTLMMEGKINNIILSARQIRKNDTEIIFMNGNYHSFDFSVYREVKKRIIDDPSFVLLKDVDRRILNTAFPFSSVEREKDKIILFYEDLLTIYYDNDRKCREDFIKIVTKMKMMKITEKFYVDIHKVSFFQFLFPAETYCEVHLYRCMPSFPFVRKMLTDKLEKKQVPFVTVQTKDHTVVIIEPISFYFIVKQVFLVLYFKNNTWVYHFEFQNEKKLQKELDKIIEFSKRR